MHSTFMQHCSSIHTMIYYIANILRVLFNSVLCCEWNFFIVGFGFARFLGAVHIFNVRPWSSSPMAHFVPNIFFLSCFPPLTFPSNESCSQSFTRQKLTCDFHIFTIHFACSSPGSAPLCSGLGQATYTVCLSPNSVSWYWPRGVISSTGWVTAGDRWVTYIKQQK